MFEPMSGAKRQRWLELIEDVVLSRPSPRPRNGFWTAPARHTKYLAIIRLWENAWAEFVPFLGLDRELLRIVCTWKASSW